MLVADNGPQAVSRVQRVDGVLDLMYASEPVRNEMVDGQVALQVLLDQTGHLSQGRDRPAPVR